MNSTSSSARRRVRLWPRAAAQERIPTEKLVPYALSEEHERGRHKTRVCASAPGTTASDWG
jgi:hypothetical protein